MVVNIGTKIIPPGQTFTFDSVAGALKRVYFRIIANVPAGPSTSDFQLSFTDTFADFYVFTASNPTFEMKSDKGTYEGKIFLQNKGTVVPFTFTYVEILQP